MRNHHIYDSLFDWVDMVANGSKLETDPTYIKILQYDNRVLENQEPEAHEQDDFKNRTIYINRSGRWNRIGRDVFSGIDANEQAKYSTDFEVFWEIRETFGDGSLLKTLVQSLSSASVLKFLGDRGLQIIVKQDIIYLPFNNFDRMWRDDYLLELSIYISDEYTVDNGIIETVEFQNNIIQGV